jgi:hypothetical protein
MKVIKEWGEKIPQAYCVQNMILSSKKKKVLSTRGDKTNK